MSEAERKAIADALLYAAQMTEHVRTAFVLLNRLSDVEDGTIEDLEAIRHRLNVAAAVFTKMRVAA